MCQRLQGKNVLITGGSRGIGYAIAVEYAREGAGIGLLSKSPASLREAAERLAREAPGTHAATAAADVADLEQVETSTTECEFEGELPPLKLRRPGFEFDAPPSRATSNDQLFTSEHE